MKKREEKKTKSIKANWIWPEAVRIPKSKTTIEPELEGTMQPNNTTSATK